MGKSQAHPLAFRSYLVRQTSPKTKKGHWSKLVHPLAKQRDQNLRGGCPIDVRPSQMAPSYCIAAPLARISYTGRVGLLPDSSRNLSLSFNRNKSLIVLQHLYCQYKQQQQSSVLILHHLIVLTYYNATSWIVYVLARTSWRIPLFSRLLLFLLFFFLFFFFVRNSSFGILRSEFLVLNSARFNSSNQSNIPIQAQAFRDKIPNVASASCQKLPASCFMFTQVY